MNFAFSEDQEELRRVVRQFLESKSPESAVREQMETESGYDPAVWSQMGDQMGLQGLIIPEEFGGSGYSYVELIVVLEEMGRRLLCAPYFSTVVLAANTLLSAGDDSAKKDYLPGIASGETIATLAFTEDGGSWDPASIRLAASRHGDGWVLDGHKSFVLSGASVGLILVAAVAGGGLSLFAVDAAASGLTATALPTLDQTRGLARLEFSAVPAGLIGSAGDATAILDRVLDVAAVALAAEQLGGAQRALDITVDYTKARHQFGRPIGSFQALKHRMADLLMEVESLRSAVAYAASAVADDSDEVPVLASLVKAYASETYFHVAAEMIQMHGGIGFTWEHDAHLFFKRAKSSELFLGDGAYHRERLAQRIGL
ncbi:MAG: acyl-CoA/acyl-ACP dehydrogenase [Actinomycetota bacterium]|nr:acyl-CoA/acyl-ACP dehydrogenase [Actinomycetota bacterium]